MFTIIKTINTLFLVTLLTACGEKTQSVEWYIKHPDVLKEEFEKCKLKSQRELKKDEHCTVIRRAQDEVFLEQQKHAPVPTFDINKFK